MIGECIFTYIVKHLLLRLSVVFILSLLLTPEDFLYAFATAKNDSASPPGKSVLLKYSQAGFEGKSLYGFFLIGGIYQSYLSVFLQYSLPDEIYLWEENPRKRYGSLLAGSLKPGSVLMECTIYPLPWMFNYLLNSAPSLASRFKLGNFNPLENLSEGYQEPWSVSIFWGELRSYFDVRSGLGLIPVASGVAGIVLTGGFMQIFDHAFLYAPWYRIEFKLKGEGFSRYSRRTWDIKVGYRHYGVPSVSPSLTLVLSQTELSGIKSRGLLSLHNLAPRLEIQIPADFSSLEPSRALISLGKYVRFKKVYFGVKLGVNYEYRKKYDKTMKSFSDEREKNVLLFFHPQVIF